MSDNPNPFSGYGHSYCAPRAVDNVASYQHDIVDRSSSIYIPQYFNSSDQAAPEAGYNNRVPSHLNTSQQHRLIESNFRHDDQRQHSRQTSDLHDYTDHVDMDLSEPRPRDAIPPRSTNYLLYYGRYFFAKAFNCITLGLLSPFIFMAMEIPLLVLMHRAPRSQSVADNVGTTGTLADRLWAGPYRFIGFITSALCFPTLGLGLPVPELGMCFLSRPVPEDGLIFWSGWCYVHAFTVIVRLVVAVILLIVATILLLSEGWMLLVLYYPWYVFGWTLGMFLVSLLPAVFSLCRFGLDPSEDLESFGLDVRKPFFRFYTLKPVTTGLGHDSFTGMNMKVDSPQERKVKQKEAKMLVGNKNHNAQANAVWYHPQNEIDREDDRCASRFGSPRWSHILSTFARLFRRKKDESSGWSTQDRLFSKCYCCPEQLPKARRLTKPTVLNFQHRNWEALRQSVLDLPPLYNGSKKPITHGEPFDRSHGHSEVRLNKLCVKCDALCGRSTLLDFMAGPSLRRHVKYLGYMLSVFPLTDELFEHWDTFAQLLQEAEDGCHLCNLVLDSLSTEQRASLSERDARLGEELQASDTVETRKNAIRSGRAIYIKMLAPVAPVLGWDVNIFTRRRTNDQKYERSSLLLLPHFGYSRLPRRWKQQTIIEREHSLNVWPETEWHSEHVEPIEIRRVEGFGSIHLTTESSTGSDDLFDHLVGPWLEDHLHCGSEPALTARLPSRLVDLSGFEACNGMVEVVSQEHFTTDTIRFAALSYCWRYGDTNLLTSKSGKRFAMQISQLAPTIQDAVRATKRLGLRYLWVDTLCIQQEPEDVKQTELAKMCDIYSNAAFVISAVAARDSAESIFINRNLLAVNPCLVGANRFPALTGAFTSVYALPSRKYASQAIDNMKLSRLASRGWVFQEERLARRTVSFSTHQVILQCHGCHKSTNELGWDTIVPWSSAVEYDPICVDLMWSIYKLFYHLVDSCRNMWCNYMRPKYGRLSLPLDQVQKQHSREERIHSSFASSLREKQPVELRTTMWFQLIEAYTLRHLSDSSSKLDAIDGLARRIELSLKDGRENPVPDINGKYCYGVFDYVDSLVPSLLWYVSDERTARPIPKASGSAIPSWSWGSVDSSIKNNSTSAMTSKDISSLTVVTKPSESFNGRLEVRGKLKLAVWRKAETNETREYYCGHHEKLPRNHPSYHEQFYPVNADPTVGPEAHAIYNEEETKVGYFIPDTDEELPASGTDGGTDSNALDHQIYCLQIIVEPKTSSEREDFAIPWAARGLALIRHASSDESYRRVGYIELIRDIPGQIIDDMRGVPEVDPYNFFTHCPDRNLGIN